VATVIRPALDAGKVVLCDRYCDSTLAYQGYGRGLDLAALRAVLDFATGGLAPDLTFLLDLPADEGLRRKQAGTLLAGLPDWDRFEEEELAFHRRVREGYRHMAAAGGRWVVVDATQSVAAMERRIWQHVRPLLSRMDEHQEVIP
jgi:dTMP kinase